MPDQPSITIVKSFLYRGAQEEFSNKYHFSGGAPSDTPGWKTLADAIISAERQTVNGGVTFVRAYGYNAGTVASVAQIDYEQSPNVVVTGALGASAVPAPGDAAATIRWLTPNLNSRGKKIYLRKYMHGVLLAAEDGATSADTMLATQFTKFGVFAAKMIDGTLPGGVKYCGPQGAVASAPQVGEFITTRTLRRRSKRNPT